MLDLLSQLEKQNPLNHPICFPPLEEPQGDFPKSAQETPPGLDKLGKMTDAGYGHMAHGLPYLPPASHPPGLPPRTQPIKPDR